jgi:hypothetical protein
MKQPHPIRFDPDGLPFRPGFCLVSDATEDLMQALNDAAEGKVALEEATQKAQDALDGGADPCPSRDTFKARALGLAVWAAGTPDEYALMKPLIERLAAASDQQTLDRALGEVAVRGKPATYKTKLAKTLQSFGATLSSDSGVIGNLHVNIAGKSDSHAASLVKHLATLGWAPSGGADERRVMKSIIEETMEKTLDAWVEIHETFEHILPDTSEEMSAIVYAHRQQQDKRNKNKHDVINSMIERMLVSGLAPWKEGPFQDWKKDANPWVLEAAAEGGALRIERQTKGAPVKARSRPRL